MHDLLIVGVPILVIFAGILLNRNDVKELRTEMIGRFDGINGRFEGMNGRLDSIQADLRQFYHLTGKLEGRMDSIEKQR